MMQQARQLGLRKATKNRTKTPKFKCENCNCMRYNPCYCEKKQDKK